MLSPVPGSDVRRQMGFYFHHALNAVRAFEARSPREGCVRVVRAALSDRALVQARLAVENSAEFENELARAVAADHNRVVVKGVSLEIALGSNYLQHVRGKTRVSSEANPRGTIDTDLTGGTLVAIYLRDRPTGKLTLLTLYPNPK